MRHTPWLLAALIASCLLLPATAYAETTPTVVTGTVSVSGTVPVSVFGTPTVSGTVNLTTATVQALAAAISTNMPVPTSTVNVSGTLPVSVESVGTWDGGALDAAIVSFGMAFGAAVMLVIVGGKWRR